MAVKIKLQRLGKIRNPHYRIIVADSRTRREGQAIEVVGLYNPKPNPSQIEVKSERVQYWLGVGAQPTDPVKAILKVTGDWQTFKGLPGKEGTLKVAEPKPSKQEIFAKALEDADKEAVAEATTPKKKKATKKEAADTDKNKTADKGKEADTKAEAADAAKTDAPVEEAKAEKAVSE